MSKTRTVRGFGFLLMANGIGVDEKARVSACRRVFKVDGWTVLRTVGNNAAIVSASSITGNAPTVFSARGVKVQALGVLDVEWSFSDETSAMALRDGTTLRVHEGTPAVVSH